MILELTKGACILINVFSSVVVDLDLIIIYVLPCMC